MLIERSDLPPRSSFRDCQTTRHYPYDERYAYNPRHYIYVFISSFEISNTERPMTKEECRLYPRSLFASLDHLPIRLRFEIARDLIAMNGGDRRPDGDPVLATAVELFDTVLRDIDAHPPARKMFNALRAKDVDLG
jgi:hypothetical protein